MGSHTNGPTADPLVRSAMDSMRRIVQTIRIASRAAERNFGLSGAQLFVLQRLGEAENASVNELAARTLTHQSSVSVVVHRLVEKELVHREASTTDARRAVLSLTPKGRDVIRRAPQAAQDWLIAAICQLPRQSRTLLAKLLQEIAGAAGDLHPYPPLFFEDFHASKSRKKRNESR